MTSINKYKEEELIYSNLLETVDVGFYSVTLEGQMLNHNKAHNTILGYEPSKSLESLDVRQFWQNPEDRDDYVEHLLNNGFTKDYICHALKKDGTKIIVELNSHLIKDRNGLPIRIDGTFIDITEKYNLRRELEESEEKYRDLVNRVPDLLLEVDLKGKFTYASPQLYDIFGFTPDEIIGKRFHKFVHPDDIPAAGEAMKKGFETKEKITVEYRTLHKDGHYIYASAKGSFLENGRFYGVVRDISETKIMEQKLKESEEKYRDIAELLPDVIFEGDLNLKLTYVNSIGFKKFGYTPEDLESGLFMIDFLDSDYKTKGMTQIKSLLQGNATKPEKYLMCKKDGTKFYARIHSRPIIKNNEVIGIRGTITDISDIVSAEQKVRENEERFRRMADNIHEGLTIIEEGKVIYVNGGACKIFGYPLEELVKLNGLQVAAPEERERLKAIMDDAKKNGNKIEDLKFWIVQKDGTRRYIQNHYSFGLKEKKVVNRFVTTTDITDQELTEKKLKESEEKYRLISETAYDLIGVLNDKFKYEYINETAFQQILGYSSEDLIGKSALEFTHPNDIASTANALIDGFKRGEGGAELRFRHKDGQWVWIEAKGKTYIDKDGKFKAIVISRNISERKISERKLTESEKKYRDAYNRANFYQDLFAHDINNILHIINASMELVSYSLSNSEKSKVIEEAEYIINKQVERGAKLVSNVHTLSKLEEEEIPAQPTEICKLMENAIDFVKKTYNSKNIQINKECVDEHIIINANELLQGVFENIFLNAIKYNENNEITIAIKSSKIKIDSNHYYKIEFIDNGIGVPDERKKIIFKQGNREFKGTKGMGLGLSLVKKILNSFNGKIWVEDNVKGDYTQGSNFIILLPE